MTVFTPYFNSFFFDTYLKCAILALPRAWKYGAQNETYIED